MNSEWWYVPKYLLEEKKGPFFEHAIVRFGQEKLRKRCYVSYKGIRRCCKFQRQEVGTMPLARVNRINLYFETHGRKGTQPLLLINGFGGTCQDWGPLASMLSKKFFVITYDNRGAGKSDIPNPPYSMKELTADAVALLDWLNLETTGVFGISMGGMIAQHLALSFPHRVEKLILGCTTCKRLAIFCQHAGESTQISEFLKSLPYDPEKKKAVFEDRMRSVFSKSFLEKHHKEFREFVENALKSDQSVKGYWGQLTAILGHNLCTQLSQIAVPTLVLHGTADNLVPLEEGLILAERIPHARFIAFEGAGHLFYLEQPVRLTSIITQFFDSNSKDKITK